MICSLRRKPKPLDSEDIGRRIRRDPGYQSPYGLPFWRAYMANTAVMVAIALLYRYADFVTLLGGTELHLGWIVGVGMVGSLLVRLLL